MGSRVSVTLTNRWAWVTDANPVAYQALRDYWSYYAPGHYFAPEYQQFIRAKAIAIKTDPGIANTPGWEDKLPGWSGKIRMFKRGKIPSGLFRATYKDVSTKLKIKFKISRELPEVEPFQVGIAADKKYNHQNRCVNAMLKRMQRGGCIVLACTGSGKTATTAMFFSRLQHPCLFVVHRKNLLYQTQKELSTWLHCKIGIVGDSIFDPANITVATIQTMHLHKDDKKFKQWMNTIRVVVVDELHKQMARRNFSLLDKLKKTIARYGLTATLELGQKPIRTRAYAFAGPVGFRFPIAKGIKQKVVTGGRALQLLFEEEIYVEYDYQDEYATNVMENETKFAVCKEHVKILLDAGKYVIVLVERVDHVKALDVLFHNTPHRLAYGAIRKVDREQAQQDFEAGKIRLIIANQVYKDGISINRVDAIIDMAEWKSKSDTIQKFGRGVRLHEAKQELLYIDYGTQTGRFHEASKSRARALKREGIPVSVVKVNSIQAAVRALKGALNGDQAEGTK